VSDSIEPLKSLNECVNRLPKDDIVEFGVKARDYDTLSPAEVYLKYITGEESRKQGMKKEKMSADVGPVPYRDTLNQRVHRKVITSKEAISLLVDKFKKYTDKFQAEKEFLNIFDTGDSNNSFESGEPLVG